MTCSSMSAQVLQSCAILYYLLLHCIINKSDMHVHLHPALQASSKVSYPACSMSSVGLVQGCDTLLQITSLFASVMLHRAKGAVRPSHRQPPAQQEHFVSFCTALTLCLGKNPSYIGCCLAGSWPCVPVAIHQAVLQPLLDLALPLLT